jgi:histidinol phosphatase-like enzyme
VFRKPAPGMFKMAQQEFDLNLARCWMIGHKTIDILAASRAGMGSILVETGEGGNDGAFLVDPHFIEPDITRAVAQIRSFERSQRV